MSVAPALYPPALAPDPASDGGCAEADAQGPPASATGSPVLAPVRRPGGPPPPVSARRRRGTRRNPNALIKLLDAGNRLDERDGDLADEWTSPFWLTFRSLEGVYAEKAAAGKIASNRMIARIIVAYASLALAGTLLVIYGGAATWESGTTPWAVMLHHGLLLVSAVIFLFSIWRFKSASAYARATAGLYLGLQLAAIVLFAFVQDEASPHGSFIAIFFLTHILSGLTVFYQVAVNLTSLLVYIVFLPTVTGFPARFVLVNSLFLVGVFAGGLFMGRHAELYSRLNFLTQRRIEVRRSAVGIEQKQAEIMLHSLFPADIAHRLAQSSTGLVVDDVPEVPVIFCMIQGLRAHDRTLTPVQHTGLVNTIFGNLDEIVDLYYVEKVKSISDSAYLLCGSYFSSSEDGERQSIETLVVHAARFAQHAHDMIGEIFKAKGIKLKIGIACGPIATGVIGTVRLNWDTFGDTVNMASRMATNAPPGHTMLAPSFAERMQACDPDNEWAVVSQGRIPIKGKGPCEVFDLECKRRSEHRDSRVLRESFYNSDASESRVTTIDRDSGVGLLPGGRLLDSRSGFFQSGGVSSSVVRSSEDGGSTAALDFAEEAVDVFQDPEYALTRFSRQFRNEGFEEQFQDKQIRKAPPHVMMLIKITLAGHLGFLILDALLIPDALLLLWPVQMLLLLPAALAMFRQASIVSQRHSATTYRDVWRFMTIGYHLVLAGILWASVLSYGLVEARYVELRVIVYVVLLMSFNLMSFARFCAFFGIALLLVLLVIVADPRLHEWAAYTIFSMVILAAFALSRLRAVERERRRAMVYRAQLQSQEEVLEEEKGKTDRLLLSALPASVVRQMQTAKFRFEAVTTQVPTASVLQLDLKGFTAFSATVDARALVLFLNGLFSDFDAHIEFVGGLEKLKPRGDAINVIAGLPEPTDDSSDGVVRLLRLAMLLIQTVHQHNLRNRDVLGDTVMQCRVSIATGALTGGVLGRRRFVYDAWGPAMDLAASLEPLAPPMNVFVDTATRDLAGSEFAFTAYSPPMPPGAERVEGHLLQWNRPGASSAGSAPVVRLQGSSGGAGGLRVDKAPHSSVPLSLSSVQSVRVSTPRRGKVPRSSSIGSLSGLL